ncbi:MAG: methyl-accepting chemotaxis protein [Sporomusaceae bacterium]|nr:methyl-accepting chemotaxis protein [Sporomusaceae bacterium]
MIQAGKQNIGMKIGIGFLVMIVLILVLGIGFYHESGKNASAISTIGSSNTRALTAAKAENVYTGAVLEIRRFIADGDDKYRQGFIGKMDTVVELEQQLLAKASPSDKAEVEKLVNNTNTYYSGVKERLIPRLVEAQQAKKAGNGALQAKAEAEAAAVTKELTPFAQQLQAALAAIEANEAKVVTDIVADSAQNAARVQFFSLAVMVLILAVSVLLSFVLTRMVVKPLQVMTQALDQMASGDYSVQLPPAFVNRGDEFGQVAMSLAHLRESMRELIGSVAKQSEQVAASSEELTASADQSARASTQVATVVTEIAEGALAQAKAVDAAAATVEEMSQGMGKISANALAVSQVAEAAAKASFSGTARVQKANEQMAHIEKTVVESAQVVANLGARSKEIGQIVETISGISGQTNLLALNAAIEAARAGEQGKGFAVVAEEVRKLAEQSQDAAKQIEVLIRDIQVDTDAAVAAMETGTKEVKTGTAVVEEAGGVFVEIKELVSDVTEKVQGISQAIDLMAGNGKTVAASVQQIDQVSRETAGRTQTVSAATEEQSASMEEIAASSQELARMAEVLQSAIRKFKL